MPAHSSGTPATLSTNRPPPNLGKWTPPQGFSQRLSDVGSSQPSRTPTSAFKDRRTRDPAGDDSERRHNYLPGHSRSTHTKWKRPIPFPVPPAGSKWPSRALPRDRPPDLSDSAARAFPSPSTAAHPRRATREPTRHVRSTSEEEFAGEETFENEVSNSNLAREGLNESKARRSRITHKERGSLRRAFRVDDPPLRHRNHDTPTKVLARNPKPKSKPRALNKTKVEVSIPSVVSVGNLSRILGVSLGRRSAYGKAPNVHCLDQVDFSGRCGKLEWPRKLPMIMVFVPAPPLPSQL